ncbi:MAG: hypothetical protein AAGF30_05045 [Pseudomonadota bacterium]
MTTQTNPSKAIKDSMKTATDAGADIAREKADMAKGQAADKIDDWAAAASAARDEIDETPVAPALSNAAVSLSDIATALRSKEVDELVGDARQFARDHPMIALGGAALVGFAAARFLKAGPQPQTVRLERDPWSDHLEREAS